MIGVRGFAWMNHASGANEIPPMWVGVAVWGVLALVIVGVVELF